MCSPVEGKAARSPFWDTARETFRRWSGGGDNLHIRDNDTSDWLVRNGEDGPIVGDIGIMIDYNRTLCACNRRRSFIPAKSIFYYMIIYLINFRLAAAILHCNMGIAAHSVKFIFLGGFDVFKDKDYSTITSPDELPVNFNVNVLSAFLGISKANAYKVARSRGFPRLRLEEGNKIVIPRKEFIKWYNSHLCSVENCVSD